MEYIVKNTALESLHVRKAFQRPPSPLVAVWLHKDHILQHHLKSLLKMQILRILSWPTEAGAQGKAQELKFSPSTPLFLCTAKTSAPDLSWLSTE